MHTTDAIRASALCWAIALIVAAPVALIFAGYVAVSHARLAYRWRSL